MGESCSKQESGQPSSLVSCTFTKPDSKDWRALTGTNIEVLVLTQHTLAIVKLPGFLAHFSRFVHLHRREADGGEKLGLEFQDVEDSDSDVDNLPEDAPFLRVDDPGRMRASRGGEPNYLKNLKMVFFRSEEDGSSLAQLNIGSDTLIIHFFSDCEKQRWRQQLAAALARQGDDDDAALIDGFDLPFSAN